MVHIVTLHNTVVKYTKGQTCTCVTKYSLSNIIEAITAMTQVARYINEVQKVSELYAHLFDDLLLKSGLAEVTILIVFLSNILNHVFAIDSLVWVSRYPSSCTTMWECG